MLSAGLGGILPPNPHEFRGQDAPGTGRRGRLPYNPCRAFSVLEILVAVSMLVVILTSLTYMFRATKNALHVGLSQAVVLDNARATMNLLSQTLQAMAPSQASNCLNFFAGTYPLQHTVLLSPGEQRSLLFQDLFVLSRFNDEWRTTKFAFLSNDVAGGVATLYLKSSRGPLTDVQGLANLTNAYEIVEQDSKNYRPMVEGVVHLQFYPYDENGMQMTLHEPERGIEIRTKDGIEYRFYSNALPSSVEVELAVIEPDVIPKLRALGGPNRRNLAAQDAYLAEQAGKIHFFRQRVPIHAQNRIVP